MRGERSSPEELVARAEAAQEAKKKTAEQKREEDVTRKAQEEATKEEVRQSRISQKVSKRAEVIGRAKVKHGTMEKTKVARARIARIKEGVKLSEEDLAPEMLEAEQRLNADEIGLGEEIGRDVQEVADLEAEEGVLDAVHEEALTENKSRDNAKAESKALVERKKQEQSEKEQQEQELQELRKHIDELALKVISIWNEDDGFTLRLTSEKGESGYSKEDAPFMKHLQELYDEIAEKKEELRDKFKANGKPKWFSFGARDRLTKEITGLEDQVKEIEAERKALSRKSEKAHKSFSTTQTELGEAVIKYEDLSYRAGRGGVDKHKEFPFIRAYREGKDERAVGYVENLTKFFDSYGFDILKRAKKKGK